MVVGAGGSERGGAVRPTATGLGALLLLAALSGLTGCRQEAETVRLSVRGGPSLDAVFSDLAAAYEAEDPQVDLVLNFNCPPCILFREDQEAADIDVFASIGSFEIERLARAGKLTLVYEKEAGRSPLCLATSERVQAQVRSLADLHGPAVQHIGVGDPETVAVGFYAKQALEKAGLWREIEERLVYSQSGCELLKWLGLGRDIDAAIVFSVCQKDNGGTVQSVAEFPADLIPPVPLLLGVSASSLHEAEARRFVDFVCGPRGAETLRAYHVVTTGAND